MFALQHVDRRGKSRGWGFIMGLREGKDERRSKGEGGRCKECH